MSDRGVKAQRSKTALVLAGGGVTGAAYEIGALRALDDLLHHFSVNDFDVFIGTSAGALVAACLANGLTPHELMRHLEVPLDGIAPLNTR
jgi:Predicted esterase of the alpha-beta hydrolase superfamily